MLHIPFQMSAQIKKDFAYLFSVDLPSALLEAPWIYDRCSVVVTAFFVTRNFCQFEVKNEQ